MPPLAASEQSDRKRNFKKQILNFGMRILDLRYSACRESFVERSILLKRQSKAIPPFIIRYFLFGVLRFAFNVVSKKRRPPAKGQPV
ncbi:hypothetical protein D1AOALGA4SA_12474 [Olavius algarvensis Delta 1 endosymbiont]|nr:hypothetical protein D1AOALGA4SA_12474 [Olavius algarvensis Delta 1 endosymbiont]